ETFYREIALPAIARGEEWHWTLRFRSAPFVIIGSIGLIATGDTNRGFWLDPRWQRQGLMTEACDVVTDYWFNTLRFPILRVAKAIANEASRRISEKQGMRMVAIQEREYVGGRLPSEIWEITADEWRANRLRRSNERS